MNLQNFVGLHSACIFCRIYIVMCRVVRVAKLMDSSLDDLNFSTLVTSSPLLITLKYSAIADLHTFQFPFAHALGFFIFTSCLLAMDRNTETSFSNYCEVFLLFRLQSLWNLRSKNSSGLTPPVYDWLVTALNEFCHSLSYSGNPVV
jgi:hypothetical protein